TRDLPPVSLDGVTGVDGRFRLRPPARPETVIEFHPPPDSPYLAVRKEMDWSEAVVRSTYVWGGIDTFGSRKWIGRKGWCERSWQWRCRGAWWCAARWWTKTAPLWRARRCVSVAPRGATRRIGPM